MLSLDLPTFCCCLAQLSDDPLISCLDLNPDMKGSQQMDSLFPKTATEKLYELIKQDIDSFRDSYIPNEYGHHWDQLSEAEAEVFNLSLDIMPDLVALWVAYEAVSNICVMYDATSENLNILEGVRDEYPWLKRAYEKKVQSCRDFERFGKLFGYPYRLTYAAYHKREIYDYRMGLFVFSDERPSYEEPNDV